MSKGKKEEAVEMKITKSQEPVIDPLAGLDPSEVKNLILGLQAQINDLKKNAPKDGKVNDVLIPLDDYMDVPAVFFCFSHEYAIHADIKNGKQVLPPGPSKYIKFKKLYRYARRNAGSRGMDVVSVSQFTTRSKAEAEWVRTHSYFEIKFFENLNDVKSVDTTLAEKMAESASIVSQMSDMQMIERSKALGLKVHSDLDTLRKELIQTMARNDLSRRKKSIEAHLSAERDNNGRLIQESIINKPEARAKASATSTETVY